jgi:hypothetical protein
VTHVFGDYWDVYRMAFLSGKQITGIPYPIYPNRFPGWSLGLGLEEGKLLAIGARRKRAPRMYRGQQDFRAPGDPLEPPRGNDWRSPFAAVWQNDGRDPALLDRVRVVLPTSDRAGR